MSNASNQMFSGLVATFIALMLIGHEVRAEYFAECDYSAQSDPMTGFSPARLNQISTAVEAAETSPFANACAEPEAFKGRPKTGLFRRTVPLQDTKGRTTADFLKRVGVRVLGSMTAEEVKLKALQECLSKPASADCKSVRDYLKIVLRPLVKTSRMNLALAQTDGQISTLTYQANTDVNKSASALGTVKETDWDRLTPEETTTAQSILNEYVSEIKVEANRKVTAGEISKPDVRKFENDALLAARIKSGLDYTEAMALNPILQYLKSPTTSEEEVLSAVKQMRKNLASDRIFAEEAIKAVPQPESLGLFEYGSFIESELQSSPQDCGLAAALYYTKENRSTGEQLAIGVPLVVVAVALPIAGQVIAGTVVGVAGTVGYTINLKMNRDTVARRFVSTLENASQATYQKVDRANHDLKVAVVLSFISPVGGIATKAVAKSVYTGLQATRFGSNLATKTVEKVVEKNADKPTGAGK